MKEITYIGVYDIIRDGKLERECSLAAVKKMNYIISTLNRIGKSVRVVSIARNKKITQKAMVRYGIAGKYKNQLILSSALGSQKKWISSLGELQTRIWLFLWLLRNVHKGEKILVYHSQRLMTTISLAARVKGFEYILEVEELYYKFGFVSEKQARVEKEFIMGASSLIISTDNIRKELDYPNDIVLLHGNYQNLMKETAKRNKEYKIVFAGGIETVRNTAFNVCDCAEYLDECCKIYLLGYGDEESICQLQKKILEINTRLGKERLIYCGTKVGEEYDAFMLESDIAINFQNMDEYYMKFAFPSKVLNYLNYGLSVVTTPLDTIRNSEINELVIYPNNMENTPKAFAEKINQIKDNVETSKPQIANKMEELDGRFMFGLSSLLKKTTE